jgi:hypothetical protein
MRFSPLPEHLHADWNTAATVGCHCGKRSDAAIPSGVLRIDEIAASLRFPQ